MLYLDNAATTPVLPEVRDVMLNYIADNYGNPSSIYKIGRMNKIALEEARKIVAETIGSASDEVFFTSGGTESDNWVLESALTGSQVHDTTGGSSGKKGHIIVSSIEHPAIMNKCRQLEKRGYKVTYVSNFVYSILAYLNLSFLQNTVNNSDRRNQFIGRSKYIYIPHMR